jgi:Dolichyl-phosphate-mannose-protein mannosyltransferase
MPTETSTTQPSAVAPRTYPSAAPGMAFFSRPLGQWMCVGVLIAVALLRIIATYHVFNHTIDEPSHIAGGIEWWEKGTYTLETKHTPLARISVALGPYLAGVRGTGATVWYKTYPILSENGRYWLNLTLGRIGVLPYFILTTVLVFLWTKRLYGTTAALLAAAVFTQLPVILAHSSVATTDVPLMAMFCWSLYAFTRWLREPSMRNAAEFGLATGLALCTKLSAAVYLPASGVPILATYALAGKPRWRELFRSAVIVVLCAAVATWAIYRFSHAPLSQITRLPDRAAAKVFGKESHLTGAVRVITAHILVPAPEFFDGIRMLRDQNHLGSRGYLFGRVRDGGWWYFFLVALSLKTPLAVLLLATAGAIMVARHYWRDRSNWQFAAPVIALAMIMIASTPARLDSGVRYVMPVFVFIAILSGFALSMLWERQSHRLLSRVTAVLLFTWLAFSSARVHPDYLSYFNELAGRDPSRYIVIGDLDWGQDLTRLSAYLRQHSVTHLSIAYDAYFDPAPLGLPDTERIQCNQRPSGWVAIELRRSKVYSECYPWLVGQHPIAKVGKTISVYYLEGS